MFLVQNCLITTKHVIATTIVMSRDNAIFIWILMNCVFQFIKQQDVAALLSMILFFIIILAVVIIRCLHLHWQIPATLVSANSAKDRLQ